LVGGGENQPTLQEVWEEFGRDPLFWDLEVLGDLRTLRSAVVYIAREYPQFEGAKRIMAIRNAFLAFGGRRKGYSARNNDEEPAAEEPPRFDGPPAIRSITGRELVAPGRLPGASNHSCYSRHSM